MKKRLVILLGAGLLVSFCVAVVITFKPFEEGPRYRALPVSYWGIAVSRYLHRSPATTNADPLSIRLQTILGLYTKGGQPAILRGDPAALPVLLRLLRDEQDSVHNAAFQAIKALPSDKEIWQAIALLLVEKDWKVRIDAERLLFSFGYRAGKEAVPVLSELLQSEDRNIRTEALNILLRIGPEAAPAVPTLVKMLKGGWPERYYAALVLKRIGPSARSAVPDLILMLKDEDELCRKTAREALLQIDPQAARQAGIH